MKNRMNIYICNVDLWHAQTTKTTTNKTKTIQEYLDSKGGVVQLPAPHITMCNFFYSWPECLKGNILGSRILDILGGKFWTFLLGPEFSKID